MNENYNDDDNLADTIELIIDRIYNKEMNINDSIGFIYKHRHYKFIRDE